MQKSNLNTSQGINTGKVFRILNTKYIYSILSSNLNTCILNTDQHCPPYTSVYMGDRQIQVQPGVKVSRNAPERRSGTRKFKPGAFRLHNYWISQPEHTFLRPASWQPSL